MMKVSGPVSLGLAVALGCAGPADDPAPDEPTASAAKRDECDWPQWGGDPAHRGEACREVKGLDRIVAHHTFDPYVAQEQADALLSQGNPALYAHFQTPLVVGDDLYMEWKAGHYTACADVAPGAPCGPLAWNTQVWAEKKFHWHGNTLVEDWTFESDWKPEPPQFFGLWEPVFHAVVAGDYLYVPGARGAVHKLDRHTGVKLATIGLPGGDDATYVAGGLAADRHGNIYYNALALDPAVPQNEPRHAWLVKVRPDDTVQRAEFTTIVTGAPGATDLCRATFGAAGIPRPWPPSPTAVPPSFPCGRQRPSLNVTPAIGEDGTVVTVSTAHRNRNYSYVVAVNADLTPKWTASMRGILADGCGTNIPIDAPPGTTDPVLRTHCTVGTTPGVDPATNTAPAGQAIDLASSSPVIAPDGSVLYGAFTSYNQFRGHLFKWNAQGVPQATYDFGWDVTPAIHRHDGTYSVIIKDNYYFDAAFYMTQLDANLVPEWTFEATNSQSCTREPDGDVVCVEDPDHPTGFEWCVNAPAVDRDGNVYANSEDGWVYKIGPGGVLEDRIFLLAALGAAYTPISIDRKGRLYSLNGGDLFVIEGNRGHGPGHDGGDDD